MNGSKTRFSDRRTRRLLFTLGAMLLALVLIGLFLYMRVNVLLNGYMEGQGKKQAETLAELTERQFEVELTALYTVASEMTRIDDMRGEALRALQEADPSGKIGMQRIDGTAYYGEAHSMDDFPCIERAVHGENAISYCAGKGLMFAVPAMRGDNIAYVVYLLYPEDVLFERFGVTSYSGSGRTRVEDIDDRIIVDYLSPDSSEMLIFDEPTVAKGINVLETTLYTSGSAAVFRNSSIGEVMLYAAVIDGTDYHLVGYVPKTAVMEGVQGISALVILVFAILAAMVFLGGFLLIGLERKSRESDALREAARIAEKSSAAKSEFLSNMSHDIRTPMNAIIGFTNLALRDPSDTPQVTEYLGKIRSSSDHLLSLINDVLEMSRIESGKIELEEAPCLLPEILRDLHTIIIGQVEAKQQELTMDEVNVVNEGVCCDKLRLNQVLLNLLSNAVKYTPDGGTIAVRVEQLESEDPERGVYEFRVKDNGIGMTPEFAAKVFDAFEREHTSTVSRIQGTGLGMAITKSIVELMGGEIWVNTEKGNGSEFVFRVSFRLWAEQPEQSAKSGESAAPTVSFAGRRLLLVDDIEMNREIAVAVLEMNDFTVEEACDGTEAVEKVTHAEPGYFDAVLMDVQMPTMNGYEATRAIRASGTPNANIPIIAMTANAFEEDKKAALAAGMDGHVAKPIDVEKLMGVLGTILQK